MAPMGVPKMEGAVLGCGPWFQGPLLGCPGYFQGKDVNLNHESILQLQKGQGMFL